jgi:hypothetical protein
MDMQYHYILYEFTKSSVHIVTLLLVCIIVYVMVTQVCLLLIARYRMGLLVSVAREFSFLDM